METARPTPSTVHLWARLQQLLHKAVQRLSIQITDTDNVIQNNILQTICDMTAIEVSLARAKVERGLFMITDHFLCLGISQHGWHKSALAGIFRRVKALQNGPYRACLEKARGWGSCTLHDYVCLDVSTWR